MISHIVSMFVYRLPDTDDFVTPVSLPESAQIETSADVLK